MEDEMCLLASQLPWTISPAPPATPTRWEWQGQPARYLPHRPVFPFNILSLPIEETFFDLFAAFLGLIGLSASRRLVFKVKKRLDDGRDLTPWPRAERSNGSRMSGRSCGCRPMMADFRRICDNGNIYQELLRKQLVPGSTGPHCQDHPAIFTKFRTLADYQPCLMVLNTLDFSIWRLLQAKVQATSHGNLAALHPSVAMEWDRLAPEHITQAQSSATGKPSLRIWSLHWIDRQPIVQCRPTSTFQGYYKLQ